MPEIVELVGYFAAFMTSLAFLPQAIMVWRNGDTRSISLGRHSLFVIGVALWAMYGFMLSQGPLIAANVFTLVLLSSSILFKKVIHTRIGKA